MEDILHKDIFNDKDLIKLSPDYTPSIQLRMEMRRNLVKDTYGVGTSGDGFFKSGSWIRKSIKKTKGCYKFNREIAKIRNNFLNLDLKNKLMLKYVDSIKPKISKHEKKLIRGNDIEIEEERNIFLEEITEDMNNLVIDNDAQFHLNEKNQKQDLKLDDIRKDNYKNVAKIDPVVNGTGNGLIDMSEVENILRIECKNIGQPKYIEEIEFNVEEMDDNPHLTVCPGNNEIDNDLNSLLVMMAITPKLNNEEQFSHRSEDKGIINKDIFEIADDEKTSSHPNSSRSRSRTAEVGDINDILNIAPMRIKISSREQALLEKYVEKWRKYVNRRKEELSLKRQATLNNFFDKLSRKKMLMNEDPEYLKRAKLLAQDCNTYQRRYKIQKHIIALQRAKLEEQNRVIEELKYNKIVDASKQSVEALREEVRNRYNDMDRQLKPKIKMLTNELKLQDIQDQSLVLHCLKVPQFLQRMEKRAREREEKHAMIRERRKQMEEDRIRQKQQAEIAKAEMDKEEKIKRMNELRQKRKREKIETIRKKQYAARLRALIVMADLHYEKTILSKYGIRPFRLLLTIKRDNLEKAKAHYMFQLKNNTFLNWMWYTEDMWYERNFKADEFHRKKLLRRGIEAFRKNTRLYILQKQVAHDYYDLYITQTVFRKFREGIEVVKKEEQVKWKRAVAYHNSNIIFKTFVCWRSLPALNALKREQDARKARWREKVLQVVPDYVPPED